MWVDHMCGLVMTTYQKRILEVFIQIENGNDCGKMLTITFFMCMKVKTIIFILTRKSSMIIIISQQKIWNNPNDHKQESGYINCDSSIIWNDKALLMI